MVFAEKITIREKYGPAMEITDPKEAAVYFEACVAHTMRFGRSRDEAERIERSNLGYYAGYYDAATAKRVLRLFGAAHPVFGMVQPAPEEAFGAGKKLAEGR